MKIYGEIKDITLVKNGVREDGQAYQINSILFEVAGSGDTIVAETFQNNENFANRGIVVGAKGDMYIKMEAKWSSKSMKYWQRTVFDRFDAHIGGQPNKQMPSQIATPSAQPQYQQGQMQGMPQYGQPQYQQGQMQGMQQQPMQQGQMPYMGAQQMAQYAPGLMMPPQQQPQAQGGGFQVIPPMEQPPQPQPQQPAQQPAQQQMFQAPMPTNDLPFD